MPGLEATLAAVAILPEDQKVDALLQILEHVLRELPMATLRRKRSQFAERFSQCGCSFEVCSAVMELVDVHLAHRARTPRKSAPDGVHRNEPPLRRSRF